MQLISQAFLAYQTEWRRSYMKLPAVREEACVRQSKLYAFKW